MNMKKIGHVDVRAARRQLAWHPYLWNQHRLRTSFLHDSPHREVSDIWLRYNAIENFDPENPQTFAEKHESVNYPAWSLLPTITEIISNLVTEGDQLGGVLITKIPPGCMVLPHSDAGYWHSEYYETKLLILLNSATGQKFCFKLNKQIHEEHEGKTGDVFEFNNHPVHWVENKTPYPRISLIAAVKRNR